MTSKVFEIVFLALGIWFLLMALLRIAEMEEYGPMENFIIAMLCLAIHRVINEGLRK